MTAADSDLKAPHGDSDGSMELGDVLGNLPSEDNNTDDNDNNPEPQDEGEGEHAEPRNSWHAPQKRSSTSSKGDKHSTRRSSGSKKPVKAGAEMDDGSHRLPKKDNKRTKIRMTDQSDRTLSDRGGRTLSDRGDRTTAVSVSKSSKTSSSSKKKSSSSSSKPSSSSKKEDNGVTVIKKKSSRSKKVDPMSKLYASQPVLSFDADPDLKALKKSTSGSKKASSSSTTSSSASRQLKRVSSASKMKSVDDESSGVRRHKSSPDDIKKLAKAASSSPKSSSGKHHHHGSKSPTASPSKTKSSSRPTMNRASSEVISSKRRDAKSRSSSKTSSKTEGGDIHAKLKDLRRAASMDNDMAGEMARAARRAAKAAKSGESPEMSPNKSPKRDRRKDMARAQSDIGLSSNSKSPLTSSSKTRRGKKPPPTIETSVTKSSTTKSSSSKSSSSKKKSSSSRSSSKDKMSSSASKLDTESIMAGPLSALVGADPPPKQRESATKPKKSETKEKAVAEDECDEDSLGDIVTQQPKASRPTVGNRHASCSALMDIIAATNDAEPVVEEKVVRSKKDVPKVEPEPLPQPLQGSDSEASLGDIFGGGEEEVNEEAGAEEGGLDDSLGDLLSFESSKNRGSLGAKSRVSSMHASLSALDFVSFSTRNFVKQRKDNFEENYSLGQLLGEGAFGEVFIGYQKRGHGFGEERAVKVINKGLMCDDDYEQVLNEFELLKDLDHPNILRMYEFFENDKSCYIVTDICKGGELWDEIDARGNFTEEAAARFMTHLLTVVAYLQQHKIVHRDLNLENILLEESKELDHMKIIDFGLATRYKDGTKLTEPVGKIHYVTPQVLEQNYEGSKYDVWSAGVVAFIIIGGFAPFDGDDDREIREQIMIGDVHFEDEEWDGISDDCKDFLKYVLTYDEEKRPNAEQALKHRWIKKSIKNSHAAFMTDYGQTSIACLNNMQEFDGQDFILKQAAYTLIASQLLMKEEKEEIDRVFRGMDYDCDGKLSREDIKKGYKRFFDKKLSDQEVDKLFDRVNQSGSGFIDYSEFVIAAMQKSKILDRNKLRAAFNSFDKAGKGFITKENLREVLSDIGAMPVAEHDMEFDEIIDEMMSHVDVDGAGHITYESFEAMMLNATQQEIDLDGPSPSGTPDKKSDKGPAEKDTENTLLYDWATASWIGDDGDWGGGGSNRGSAFMADVGTITEEDE